MQRAKRDEPTACPTPTARGASRQRLPSPPSWAGDPCSRPRPDPPPAIGAWLLVLWKGLHRPAPPPRSRRHRLAFDAARDAASLEERFGRSSWAGR